MCKHWTPLKEIYWQYKKEFFRSKQKNAIIESPRRTQAKNDRGAQKRIIIYFFNSLKIIRFPPLTWKNIAYYQTNCELMQYFNHEMCHLWERERERAFLWWIVWRWTDNALAYGYKRFLILVFLGSWAGLSTRAGKSTKLYLLDLPKNCNHKLCLISKKNLYIWDFDQFFLFISLTETYIHVLTLYNVLENWGDYVV